MGGITTVGEQPKACAGCGTIKPAGAYYVARGMRDGRMSVCRECMVEKQRLYREREKSGEKSIIRQSTTCSRGVIEEETFEARRDQYIILLAAAANRWCAAEDTEEQDGAKEALIFRCRQLLEAESMVST
jgi:hypothetical protein